MYAHLPCAAEMINRKFTQAPYGNLISKILSTRSQG